VHIQRFFMAVTLGVDVVMKVAASEFAVHQFHTAQLQDAVTVVW